MRADREASRPIIGFAAALTLAVASVVIALAVDRAAAVAESAERGESSETTGTLSPPPGCARVAVIRDSLMDNAEPWMRGNLREAG